MLAYVVLLLAVLSRFLPLFHATAWNFTAIGGGLLFFGSRMGSTGASRFTRSSVAKLVSAVAVLIATDYCLTVFAYHYPFHATSYLVTWIWYAAVCLLGMGILSKPSVLRVALGAVASSTSFFLVSNFVVWTGGAVGSMYPRTLAGLSACYAAALPFYRSDLASTALTAGVLFGVPVLAAKIAESMNAATNTTA